MKKAAKLFVFLFLCTLLASNLFAAEKYIPKDGTFLLHQKKEKLDYELKKKFFSDPSFRANILASNRQNLVLKESEVGFQVYNFISGSYEYNPGIFVAEGKFCRVFLEKKNISVWGQKSEAIFQQIVDTFDKHVYPSVTSWFGEPVVPQDFFLSDQKIFIFLVDIRDNFSEGYVAGYFDHRDIEGLFGNQKPLFFMDINPGEPGNPSDKANSFYRTLAHEFQHMVSFSRRVSKGHVAQERWFDEGLSMFSEFIFSGRVGENSECLTPSPHYERFVESPDVNIFSSSNESWFKEHLLYRQYGGSFLFTTYLIEKYGGASVESRQKFTRELIEVEKPGATGLDSLLSAHGTSLQEVFNNWTIACFINDKNLNEGKWHFSSIKIFDDPTIAQLPLKKVRHFYSHEDSSFVGAEGSISPNTANLEEIAGDGKINLKFNFEETMTPALVSVFKDNTTVVKPMNANASGQVELAIDLAGLDRAMVIPIAVKKTFMADEKLHYSFNSTSKGLLLYPMPNPAFPDQFVIILRSIGQPLVATPSLKISFNNLIDSPQFSNVDEERTLFVAHYRLPGSGKGQAICYSGEDSCSFSFSAATLRGNETMEAAEGNARIIISSGSFPGAVSGMISIPTVGEIPKFSGLLDGPFDVIISESSSATMVIEQALNAKDGVGICRFNDAGHPINWSNAVFSGDTINAAIKSSGRYYLAKDDEMPVMNCFDVVNNRSGCQVRLGLSDNASGINPEDVCLAVDGQTVWVKPIVENGFYCFNLGELAGGEHQFSIEFKDLAGNKRMEMRQQALLGNIYLGAPVVFPNPCKARVTIRSNFSSAVNLTSADIKIFDSAGELVETLSGAQTAPNQVDTLWTCRNQAGKKVANGVYLAKIKIHTAQGVFKSKCKIAVIQ